MSNRSKLLLPGGRPRGGRLLRNPVTGRIFPCCYGDCDKPADRTIRVRVPHDAPERRGDKLIYTFCSARHRDLFVQETRHRPV